MIIDKLVRQRENTDVVACDIHFTRQFTVLVGPNGCGKTSVLAYTAWPLSHRRARPCCCFVEDMIAERRLHIVRSFLATLSQTEQAPTLLLIDNFDGGLHLNSQVRFVKELQAACDAVPNLQIVVAGYSPFALEPLDPEQVIVMCRSEDGKYYGAAPLSQHPEFGTWTKVYRTEELWANLGEEWVLDLRGSL